MLYTKKVFILLCALLASSLTAAQNAPVNDTRAQWTESQQTAWNLLLDMATQLGEAPRFTVDMRIGYETLQDSGQKIEFGEARRLSLERPSFFLSEVKNSDGTGEELLFDGKWITVSNTKSNVYARAPQPGDIDATVKYFVRDLGMRLPLAVMLMSQFPQELEQRVIDIAYVEETGILGEPAHHLAGRTADVDFQVWISTRPSPLPLRIILIYREAPGQPEFRADFSNWKFNPSFMRNMFEFKPRAEAREIPLAAQFTPDIENGAGTTSTAPSNAGEQP